MARKALIDAQLQSQLKLAQSSGAPVGATFTLRGADDNPVLSPEEAESKTHEVIARAAAASRARPDGLSVFPNIQSFALQAPPAFLRHLLEQPEIDSAMASSRPEPMLIAPESEHEARLPARTQPRASKAAKPAPPASRRRR